MSVGNGIECIFCAIVNKQIKANIVLESDGVVAFHDINKAAPIHLLIIPKEHVANLNDASIDNSSILGEMLLTARELAFQFGLNESGYRVAMNTGRDAGQTVFHLHMHLLGGRHFSWPPG